MAKKTPAESEQTQPVDEQARTAPHDQSQPFSDEQRMYDDQVAGNPNVNETMVRRAGRKLDDERAAETLLSDGPAAAGGADVQGDRGEPTASARNAAESKSQTGQTQSQRMGMQ